MVAVPLTAAFIPIGNPFLRATTLTGRLLGSLTETTRFPLDTDAEEIDGEVVGVAFEFVVNVAADDETPIAPPAANVPVDES